MNLKAKHRKIIKWIGYPLFALLCFMISLILTFPFNQIKGKLQEYVYKNYNITMEMDRLSASLPIGIEASNVRLSSEGKQYEAMLPLTIPSIEINISLLSTLFGTPEVSFDSEIFGGDMQGDIKVDQASKRYNVEMEIDDFHFDQMPYFTNKFSELPVKGTLSLETELDLDMNQMKNSKGFLEMRMRDGVVGPGKWMLELPQLRTGDLDANFEVKDGKMVVKQFEQKSPDMQSDMRGSVSLTQNLMYSNANLDYRFRIADDLLKKHDIFKLALSAIKNAQGTDDYFYHTLRGAISNLRPIPNKAAQYKFKSTPSSKPKATERTKPSAKPDRKKPSKPAARPASPARSKPAEVKKPPRRPARTNKPSSAQRPRTPSSRMREMIPSARGRKAVEPVEPVEPNEIEEQEPEELQEDEILDEGEEVIEDDLIEDENIQEEDTGEPIEDEGVPEDQEPIDETDDQQEPEEEL